MGGRYCSTSSYVSKWRDHLQFSMGESQDVSVLSLLLLGGGLKPYHNGEFSASANKR